MQGVALKPPARPQTSQSPSYIDISPRLPSHLRMGKKNHRALLRPGATPPPQRLFFSLECGSKLLSQPLQRATTGPRSLGTTEGVEPGGRGAYVTQYAQEASRWEKKMHREKTERRRERGRGVCIWKVLSATRQEPLLCESDKGRKSTTAEAKNEGGAKPAMSFIRLGGWGNAFKSFRPTSKKNLYTFKKIKVLANNCETRGLGAEVPLWFTSQLHSVIRCTFAFLPMLRANW